jgi:hypothetical protein
VKGVAPVNIFATSACPTACAEYLDDKRVIKMALESVQILSSALWTLRAEGPYRPTHTSHPCVLWAAESRENYLWLLRHAEALGAEYTMRFGRVHKSMDHIGYLRDMAYVVPGWPMTEFVNCTPHKGMSVHNAYVKTLREKWKNDKREPKWTAPSLKS